MKLTSAAVLERGIVRPDARDVFDNQGISRADPYSGRGYPWVNAPPGYVLINRRGSIAAPANGTQALVVTFTVPQAMEAVVLFVLNVFFGSDNGGNNGSGSIVWVIDVNRPLGAAGTGLGYVPPDFGNIVTQLGSLTQGPWPVPGGIHLNERDVINYKVTTTAPVGVGAPNFVTCALCGWMWPARLPAMNAGGMK
jgi:hypothetical protein